MLATQSMVVVALAFFVAAFQARAVKRGSVRRFIRAEQIDGDAEMEVDVALNRR